jgi:hypothetical protein
MLAKKESTRIEFALVVICAGLLTACTGLANKSSGTDPAEQKVTIKIDPTSATLTSTQNQQFKATVAGTTNSTIIWAVDGQAGGNSGVGTISATGLYEAPATTGNHSVTVTSVADPSKVAKASVKVNASGVLSGVLTERYDLARTGQNLSEPILTPATVNSAVFGKLASYPVDGIVYSQPLYVYHLFIDGGTHNVVFVATENDSVYAFDADDASRPAYWQRSFIDPRNDVTAVPTSDVGSTIFPQIGITGTPVIDPASGVMYLVAYTKEDGQYLHRLHTIDITTGQDKNGGSVVIQGSVPGTSGWNSDGNGSIAFNSKYQLQRPGLLLLNGVVYVAFGSHGDNNQYHGWIFAYDAASLRQLGIWNSTPNGNAGALWAGGTALSADSAGNIYVTTANGDFGLGFGPDASDSVLRLTFNRSASDPTKAFTVADYFTPDNQEMLATDDNDLGSSGLMLIPGTHLGTVAGKEGSIYVVDLNQLGHYNSSNNSNIVQFLPTLLGDPANGGTDENFSTASYFNGNIYYIGDHDSVKQFAFHGDLLSTVPIDRSEDTFDELGAQAVISANGTGNAVLWAIEYVAGGNSGELRAYDATDVSKELYTSSQAGGRDSFGGAVKFSVPTVANGKVYVGAQYKLVVFGSL